MSKIEVPTLPNNALLDQQVRYTLARELFKRLPMVRAFDDDYEVAEQLILDVFNAGKQRGVYEMYYDS